MTAEIRWILGSIFSVVVFGLALLIYGIIDNQPPPKPHKDIPGSSSGAVVKIDKWVCVKAQTERGEQYKYSRNERNGASGPANLGCKKEE